MKDAVYGSAASMGKASAMASDDSAPMTRSLWKPGESSSAERKPASIPCTEERSGMSAAPKVLIRKARPSMACRRPAQMARFMGSLSPFRDFG